MIDTRPPPKPTLLIVLPDSDTSEEARRQQANELLLALRQESRRLAETLDTLGFSLQIEHAHRSLDEPAGTDGDPKS